eukprot:m.10212 g.10212  ORF g.10212 m.10212 type:complete len:221 (+) comp2503_c0_seq1:1-663(+)
MKGLGTDEATLVEIMTSRSNERIQAIKAIYKAHYGHELEHDVKGDTSGAFKHILVSLCQGLRDEGTAVDLERALADAHALFKAGEGSFLTHNSEFNRVFMLSNPSQLRAVAAAYGSISKHPLAEALKKQVRGDAGEAISAMLQEAIHTGSYFADRLYTAMKGLGTDDSTLIRIIVTRSEIDMKQIKESFRFRHGKTLAEMIKGDTSGAYRELLLAVIGKD